MVSFPNFTMNPRMLGKREKWLGEVEEDRGDEKQEPPQFP